MKKAISLVMGRIAALEDEHGQTTVEYAIILALVIALAVGAFAVLDPSVNTFMGKVGQAISNHLP